MFDNVRVGQTWIDYDTRMRNDFFPSMKKIIKIENGYAHVETTKNGVLTSRSKIRLYRLRENSRGYKLFKDVEEERIENAG